MVYSINRHQLNNILENIGKAYPLYGYAKSGDKLVFSELSSPAKAKLFQENGVIPFKKIIFPNRKKLNEKDNKVALIGINPCDNNALDILYKQFKNSDLITHRNNLFVLVSECKPNKYCFCEYFGAHKIQKCDLYLQKENDDKLTLFVGSEKGNSVVKNIPLKKSSEKKPRPIKRPDNKFSNKSFKSTEQKDKYIDLWTHIANNCFGCGSCSAVCPLCFCFRQEYENDLKGNSSPKICWDSCFNKEFSEIQHHFDLRPQNLDRLYNWYHHKLIRGPKEVGKPLCVGCGRCIKACPANLNQKNIMEALDDKENS